MTSWAAAYGGTPQWLVLSHHVQEHQFPAPAANQRRMPLNGETRTVGRDNGIDEEKVEEEEEEEEGEEDEEEVMMVVMVAAAAAAAVAVA